MVSSEYVRLHEGQRFIDVLSLSLSWRGRRSFIDPDFGFGF
jgi:hypothetical protein